MTRVPGPETATWNVSRGGNIHRTHGPRRALGASESADLTARDVLTLLDWKRAAARVIFLASAGRAQTENTPANSSAKTPRSTNKIPTTIRTRPPQRLTAARRRGGA